MDKVYLSRDGYEKLKQQLEALKKKRPLLAKAIGEAREHGDISENAEYDAAKEEQGMNELRIAEMESRLSRAQLIDESRMSKDEVLIGATVLLEDLEDREKIKYTLVSQFEADFEKGRISVDSPVGKGLLNHKSGETVEIKVPAGILKYKILEITRE